MSPGGLLILLIFPKHRKVKRISDNSDAKMQNIEGDEKMIKDGQNMIKSDNPSVSNSDILSEEAT